MAASRPYWKGYLKLSLVSCPIALYSASSVQERVSFRQINRKTGNRLRQQLVDDASREPVDREDRARGYEYAKGNYLLVEEEEIEKIAIESNHTVEIDRFVPRAQIDERYFETPYYIVPNDKVGQDAFAVIREAMRGKEMAALGRIVLAKRERVIMLQPWGKGLVGTTLRYPYELRDTKDYFEDIPVVTVPKEMLELAQHILETKKADFDPTEFVDRYEEAVVAMLKKKQAGIPMPKEAPAPAATNVVNLMDALRRSISEGKRVPAESKGERGKHAQAGRPKPAAKKTAARGGSKQKKAG